MAASIAVKHLDDITECPICSEVFDDPRVLPCIHTYCLKCIRTWSQKKKPEDKLACPVCRKEVDVPVEELPRNFFVQKLLEVKKLSSTLSDTEVIPCDLCGQDESQAAAEVKSAIAFCVECQQNMCQSCSVCHKRIKATSSHTSFEIGRQKPADEQLMKFYQPRCDHHPEETVKIYCFDCQLAVCMMCCVTDHSSHKCSDVKKVAEDFTKQIQSDVDAIVARVSECQEVLQKLATNEQKFREHVDQIEKQITDKAEELKQLIDNYKLKLTEELMATKAKQKKYTATVRDEVERRLLMIETFKKYSEELRTKGTACDIVRAASGLHKRAKELSESDSVQSDSGDDISNRYLVDVRFSSRSLTDEFYEMFGKLDIEYDEEAENTDGFEDNWMKSSKPSHILPVIDYQVGGVTCLGDEIFVLPWIGQQIHVYDAQTLTLRRHLAVSAQGLFRGIAACSRNKCLYVSDTSNSNIYRADVAGSNEVTKWTAGSQPYGLSVNSDHNLLVACHGGSKIQEFTTRGDLVREISLHSGMSPLTVVQLSSGQFGITHEGPLHRYCVAGLDGIVIKSYGSSPGSGDGQLYYPYGFAVNKRRPTGSVFIADYSNGRILMLNPVTFTATKLPVDGLSHPFCVCVDDSRGRLYIADLDGRQVLVLGN